MIVKKLTELVTVIAIVAVLAGCGSSSSTPAATTTGSTTNSTLGDTVVVKDLTTLPNVSTGAKDLTANIAAQKAFDLSKAGSVGSVATTGCMALKYFKPLALANLKLADVFKCYISTTQAGAGKDTDGNFVINAPSDDYAYYLINLSTTKSVKVRIRNVASADNSSNTFKMGICESNDSGATFKHTTEYSMNGNTTNKEWTSSVTTHFDFSGSGVTLPGDDTPITSEFDNTTAHVIMNSADAMSSAFDIANVTSVDSTGYQVRNPTPIDSTTNDITTDATIADAFKLGFKYDSAAALNTASGSFRASGNVANGIIYAQFNATNGEGLLRSTQRGQAFSLTSPEKFNPAVDPPLVIADAGTIDISSVTLTNSDIVDGTDSLESRKAVIFGEAWDCTAPTGKTFTTIDATDSTKFDYSSCDAIQTGVSTEVEKSDSRSCFSNNSSGAESAIWGKAFVLSSVTGNIQACGNLANGGTVTLGQPPSNGTVAVSFSNDNTLNTDYTATRGDNGSITIAHSYTSPSTVTITLTGNESGETMSLSSDAGCSASLTVQ